MMKTLDLKYMDDTDVIILGEERPFATLFTTNPIISNLGSIPGHPRRDIKKWDLTSHITSLVIK
jgi:hypothetical protein